MSNMHWGQAGAPHYSLCLTAHCPSALPQLLQDEPTPVQSQHIPPHGYQGPLRTTQVPEWPGHIETQITSHETCPLRKSGQWSVCMIGFGFAALGLHGQ